MMTEIPRSCQLFFSSGFKMIRKKLLLIALTAILLAQHTGCVRRRMTIRSNPPGATVYVDDHLLGTTPVSSEFVYYGTRRVKLIKDGYETITALQTISAPWYQIPPLDLITENFIGREIRDERVMDFTMKPQQVVPTGDLLKRAGNLRNSSRIGAIVPRPPQSQPLLNGAFPR